MLYQHFLYFCRRAARPLLATTGVALLLTLPATVSVAQGVQSKGGSVEQLTAMLQVIDPYCPNASVSETVAVFGSTSMDALAHGWASGYKQFHPQAKVEISAANSEQLLPMFKTHPTGVAMISRPVAAGELDELRKQGLKQPVAFMVAREALSVYVHQSNPVSAISGEQLRAVFTTDTQASSPQWGELGATGTWAKQPMHIILRTENSGTQHFLSDFVFSGAKLRPAQSEHTSNAKVLQAISSDPSAISICGFRSSGSSVKALQLINGNQVIPCDDQTVLSGQYPLMRPMSLIIDLGQTGPKAVASQELVRYALGQAGQTQAILVGFFPVDLPLLRAGMETLAATPVQ